MQVSDEMKRIFWVLLCVRSNRAYVLSSSASHLNVDCARVTARVSGRLSPVSDLPFWKRETRPQIRTREP